VPFAAGGARLAALARRQAAPRPFADPDVQEIVVAVLAGHLEVASFELQPDDGGHDLATVLVLTAEAEYRAAGPELRGASHQGGHHERPDDWAGAWWSFRV
jgi:hypothetical protein